MRFLRIISIIFLTVSILKPVDIFAQDVLQQPSPQSLATMDLSTINVDELTDGQIRSYMQRAQESGLTQEEIEGALLARGLPQSELLKLKQRINAFVSGQREAGRGIPEVRTRQEKPQGDFIDILKENPEEKRIEEYQKKIFGFSLFNTDRLTFDPSLNIPTPKNYQLGPGDEVIIDIWGASEQTYQQVITPDGYILIPNLGPIYLNGLDVNRASERIKARLTKIYSGLNPPNGSNPTTVTLIVLT